MTNSFWIVSYVILWCLMTLLYGAVFLLYRHLGRDLVAKEKKSVENAGPEIGAKINSQLTTLDGGIYEIGRNGTELPNVVLFAGKHCGFCEKARPLISGLAREYKDEIRTIIVFDGTPDMAKAYLRDMADVAVAVCDPGKEIGRFWGIRVVPFAIVSDAQGIVLAKGVASEQERLDSYFKIASKGSSSN